jgi:aminoglycoside N3'-acetyltransferase
MVHASLRAIGPVCDRAAGVVAALDRAVGESGSLLMVLGARNDWSWVNERPEHERAELLVDAEPFDALVTPAEPEVGALAEVFRQSSGTVVSDHPEGRFAARGALAGHLVKDPPWDDYYGPGSALERLVDAGGKVLRLGADPDTVTLTHYSEYLVPIAGKRRVRRHRLVVSEMGPSVRVVDSLDDSEGIIDYPGEDYFAVILKTYVALGSAAIGVVGNARGEFIDAVDFARFATDWMSAHF